MLEDKYCGFDEVRKNKLGEYYCSCCGIVLSKNYRNEIALTLPKEFLFQLDKQCGYKQDDDDF